MAIIKRTGSNLWWVDFTLTGYHRVREPTGTADRKEAERYEIKRKAEVLSQPAALKGKTWLNAIQKWVEHKDPSYEELMAIQQFNQVFKDCMLSSISADKIEGALKKYCKHPATYNRHRARVLGILNVSGVHLKMPMRKVKEEERDWLTHEQWDALRKELPPHMLAMATFAIETGLRQANVLGLQWSRVDLKGGRLWIEAPDAKGPSAIGIPLSIAALNVLKSVQGQNPEFCFTYKGKPVTEIKTAFIAACIRAGVGVRTAKGNYKGFTWHGFRHTFATWHFQAGTPREIIQKLGAWKTASMLDKYQHHSVKHLKDYVNNVKENS